MSIFINIGKAVTIDVSVLNGNVGRLEKIWPPMDNEGYNSTNIPLTDCLCERN